MTREWCGRVGHPEYLPPSARTPGARHHCDLCGRRDLRIRFNGYSTCLGYPRHKKEA